MSTTLKPMAESHLNSSFEREIPSNAAAGKQVIDEMLAQLERLEWLEPDVFGVHLAVEEAVVNAIKHGNRNDESKSVWFSFEASPAHIRVRVADEGDGFDPADVPDPTEEEHLELPSGRGLMLMHCFMSSVEFNGKGNEVVLEKHLDESGDD